MIQCYSLPSCKPVKGVYFRVLDISNTGESQNTLAGISVTNLVVYDTNGVLENGLVGRVKKMQLSSSIINFTPNENDKILIDGVKYKIRNIKTKDQNLVFIPFFEAELKVIE